jgi:hypothetical protein
MELTPEELDAIEKAVDAGFVRAHGRSFSDEDMRRAKIPHAAKNGDSSHMPDSLEKVKRDYPAIFGDR